MPREIPPRMTMESLGFSPQDQLNMLTIAHLRGDTIPPELTQQVYGRMNEIFAAHTNCFACQVACGAKEFTDEAGNNPLMKRIQFNETVKTIMGEEFQYGKKAEEQMGRLKEAVTYTTQQETAKIEGTSQEPVSQLKAVPHIESPPIPVQPQEKMQEQEPVSVTPEVKPDPIVESTAPLHPQKKTKEPVTIEVQETEQIQPTVKRVQGESKKTEAIKPEKKPVVKQTQKPASPQGSEKPKQTPQQPVLQQEKKIEIKQKNTVQNSPKPAETPKPIYIAPTEKKPVRVQKKSDKKKTIMVDAQPQHKQEQKTTEKKTPLKPEKKTKQIKMKEKDQKEKNINSTKTMRSGVHVPIFKHTPEKKVHTKDRKTRKITSRPTETAVALPIVDKKKKVKREKKIRLENRSQEKQVRTPKEKKIKTKKVQNKEKRNIRVTEKKTHREPVKKGVVFERIPKPVKRNTTETQVSVQKKEKRKPIKKEERKLTLKKREKKTIWIQNNFETKTPIFTYKQIAPSGSIRVEKPTVKVEKYIEITPEETVPTDISQSKYYVIQKKLHPVAVALLHLPKTLSVFSQI